MKPMTTKTCNKCQSEKALSEFAKKKTGKLGVKAICKECANKASQLYYAKNKKAIRERAEAYRNEKRELIRAQNRASGKRQRKNKCQKERYRRDNVRSKFGLSLHEYDKYFEKVNDKWFGTCEACGKRGERRSGGMALDHCHTTGKIRGVLCKSCNCALGHVKDDKQRLLKLISYLDSHTLPLSI